MNEEEQELIQKANEAWENYTTFLEQKQKRYEEELALKKARALEKLKEKFPTLKGPISTKELVWDGSKFEYEIWELLGYKFRLESEPTLESGKNRFGNDHDYYLTSQDFKKIGKHPFWGYPVRDLQSLGGFLAAVKEYSKENQ